MTLPTDTRGEAAGSGFFKAEQGQTEVMLVDSVVTGYQAWMLDGSCKKQPEVFEEPIEGIRKKKIKDKDGNVTGEEDEKQQFYWAVALYNFETKQFEVAQFTQKGIRDELLGLQNNKNWGDPVGNYTITIEKSGEGLQTRYKVTANPAEKRKDELKEIMEQYKASPINVAEVLFGKEETPAK